MWPLGLLGLALLVSCAPAETVDRPKLVVLIGIDQFRADYLERYDALFSGGFRRLEDAGWRYKRGIVDHAPTLSYPGHATLATGAHPKTHGIASNAWIERAEDGGFSRVDGASDRRYGIVGDPGARGVSPLKIRVTGLADWIQASDPNARTVAVSTGSALAVMYGGRARDDRSENHVYWLSRTKGEFITSTYYRDRYPEWVQRFNAKAMPEFRKRLVWTNTVPEEHFGLARRDDAAYEGDEVHTLFPHGPGDISDEVTPEIENRWYYDSPLANEALFALARESVEALSLGRRQATDAIAIAVKSVDRFGHDYGPHSREQLDNIHRLDQVFGEFLTFLDERVGRDEYVIAVSADHGAPNVTEFELEEGRHARRVTEEEFAGVLSSVESLVENSAGPAEELPALIAAELEKADFIAKAMTPDDLSGAGAADDILSAYRNSYDPTRPNMYPLWTMDILRGNISAAHPANYGVQVELEYQANIWSAASTHGSAYDYDREVPIVFMGKGIEPGVSTDPARTIDVAPTLAYLAGVPFPDTVDGQVLKLKTARD
jgi:predicted AlkP superfamily pyrophosphatase or phosphodiesterase